jgi:hypothetical protein
MSKVDAVTRPAPLGGRGWRLLRSIAPIPILILLSLLLAREPMAGQQNQTTQAAQTPSQDDENQAEALQKATQNPVANLISVPVQNNSNFFVGPLDRTQDILNIQPVIPMRLNDRWNLITRIIQPIVWQPYPSQGSGGEFGFGDMNPSFFLSPAKPGKVIWGAGPTFVIPTATNNVLGQGKFSIGKK